MKRLIAKGIEVRVYAPSLKEQYFFKSEVVRELDLFKQRAGAIVANRVTPELKASTAKIYTRNFFW